VSQAKLVWATPDGDKLLGYIARVSNPKAGKDTPFKGLLKYLIRKKHWSPFSMVNVCVEVECARDVSRQITRHKSMDFQEFSGRYAAYLELLGPRDARLQDETNRQNSLFVDLDSELNVWWLRAQRMIIRITEKVYNEALKRGIAKEVARTILPEGLVPTRMFINGTLRSWIHYFELRCDPATQKEHRELAEKIREIVLAEFPTIKEVLDVK